jgi:hypothetical protein
MYGNLLHYTRIGVLNMNSYSDIDNALTAVNIAV